MKLIVNSEPSLQRAYEEMKALFYKDKYVQVKFNSGKRTLDQNALIHVWYSQIDNKLGQNDTEEQFKYMYGIPILEVDEEHREYVAMIRGKLSQLFWEERLAFMKYVPVTSLMDTKQLSEYGDTMQREMAKEGLILESNRK